MTTTTAPAKPCPDRGHTWRPGPAGVVACSDCPATRTRGTVTAPRPERVA